ncbi:MAG: hypothetical protein N2688_02500 [Burkholderiaceae bacterium]|nr:hypothetical protein [Burkholderiaceae bacterium]
MRRTVVLNATAAGEAEFMLKAGNAPGFSITEVRVMGQGVVTAPKTPAIALAPGGTPRRPEDSAPRSVASRVTAAPWKVKFSGPAELQVDLLYAPKFSLFDNPAGPKAAQLDARVRNARGDGMGVPFDLRAQFDGLTLGASVAVKTPEILLRWPSYGYRPNTVIDALHPSAITLSIANLSGAALPVRIEGGEMPAGLSAKTLDLTLQKDETREIAVPLIFVADVTFRDGDATLHVHAGSQRSEARFHLREVQERNFQALGENWMVGVQIKPDGTALIRAECWLKFPQTRNECRMVLEAGRGIARSIVMVADTGRTSSCYFNRPRIGDGTTKTIPEVVAAMETPMVVLRSLEEGKSPQAPGVRHERHMLQPVDSLSYHVGCG